MIIWRCCCCCKKMSVRFGFWAVNDDDADISWFADKGGDKGMAEVLALCRRLRRLAWTGVGGRYLGYVLAGYLGPYGSPLFTGSLDLSHKECVCAFLSNSSAAAAAGTRVGREGIVK